MAPYRHSFPLPPLRDAVSGGASVPGNRTPQRLAGTGTAESQTSRPLIPGKEHTLYVGAAGVRVRFSGNRALGAGTAVDPTLDVVYGPWSQIPFTPELIAPNVGSIYVYAEAADGAAAYEVVVVQTQS